MSFKGITHAHLLKISITHNKKQISLLNLFIKCISARSAPQTLPIKDERTFLLLNFLIICLCDSSANTYFHFKIPLLEADLSESKADSLSKNS